MLTEFEIISIVISFILCFIIIYLYEMLDICKSERDMYYKMFTYYHDEYKQYITRNRKLEQKNKELITNFRKYVDLKEKEKNSIKLKMRDMREI